VFDFLQRRWIYFVGVYFILLLISSAVRWSRAEKPFPEDKKSVEVFAVAGDKLLENTPVRFAYREFTPPVETGKLPVILIHGSPGDSGVLADLAKSLSRERRVIVPDLPGFGDSTEKIPDYSFRAHAFYLKQLAEKLNIEKFHALGFSMGGGVVLNLDEIAPERVASIEMVSAIGVQEYELLGDYRLNHALHGAQLALIWTLENLVPHFGLFDDLFLGHSYARNFYDSDQRPLREILNKIEIPFLIVHGKDDPLVPLAAAREHSRLVPQSEYHELGDNHFMIFERPETIAPIVTDFLMRVETGAAKTRQTADAKRITTAAKPFQREMLMADGSTALVFFLVLALATFVSEDLTLLTAGALAGQGQISLTLAIAACFVGVFVGDSLLYLAGRFFGRTVVKSVPLRWFVSETSLDRGAAWLGKNGMTAVFLSRVTPGLRLPIYFAAGVLKTNFALFALFFAIADIVWTPILVGAVAWFSKGAESIINPTIFSRSFWFEIVAIVLTAFIVLNLILRLATRRGRRMLAGTYLRWTRWEFWSLKFFYPPVIVYIAWLAIKYQSGRFRR
jgi:pimeloyl-ACP methyl ester carboxylesterase/membrane protein DedA with SNARE-associated domain